MSAAAPLHTTPPLSAEMLKAAELIAGGASPAKVRRLTGTPARTLYDWRKRPAFQQAIEALRASAPAVHDDRPHKEIVESMIQDDSLSPRERLDALKVAHAIDLPGQAEQTAHQPDRVIFSLPPGSDPVLIEYRARPE